MSRFRIASSLVMSTLLFVLPLVALAQGDDEGGVTVARAFDAAQQELPEGLAIDSAGNMYVTMGFPFWFAPGDGWIKRIGSDGTVTTLTHLQGGQAPAGIVVDAEGETFYAWPNPEVPETNGVYRLHGDGTSERLPGSEAIALANGLALDGQGDLFVSDSALGIVWRMPQDGSGVAEPWFSDEELLGGCEPGDVGANGIAFGDGALFAANTFRGLLVRIDIGDDGSAGPAEVVAGDATNECEPDALWGMDGIALDADGNVYALLVLQNQLVRIDPVDGSVDVLLTEADGLHNPASIAFGTQEDDRQSVYLVNYALLPPAPEGSLGPAVLRLDVGVDGRSLP